MIDWVSVVTNKSGTFPDVTAIDATGAGATDGTEFIAAFINNFGFGFSQSIMDYAGGSSNAPTGTTGTPNGVAEAAGVSQLIQGLQTGNGIGPGMYVQRAINDIPSVYGDRVLILAGQGVLRASYPDLDAATWIPGNDAAQAAAKAAGAKFWSSDDAAGTTGLELGPYLQLPDANPSFLKQYVDGTDFTVSGAGYVSTPRGVIVPYQTSDGIWRAILNFEFATTSATAFAFAISGLTFAAAPNQSISAYPATTITTFQAYAAGGTGNITATFGANQTAWSVSEDVELSSKPTWADDFDFEWGITY